MAKGLTAIEKAAAINVQLHVLLVMRADGLSKSQAQVRAYLEGADGLAQRLAPASQGEQPTKGAAGKA